MNGRRPALLPIGAVALGIAVFSLMDAAMKSASLATGVYTALLLRSVFAVIIMLPLWLWRERRRPSALVLKLHAARAVTVAGMAALFFWSLVRLPMAEGIAISFIAPLIALYLVAILLGERVRRGAVAGSLLGLGGVLVIALARLGADGDRGSLEGVIAMVASALLYAVNLVIQRRQAQLAPPFEIALFQALGVALTMLPALPWLGRMPDARAVADVALGATLISTSLVLFAWAYARAEAQVLLPMEYTAFVWSALFGWLWFGESVRPAGVAGAMLIIAGCWIAARSARSAGADSEPPPEHVIAADTLMGPPPSA